MRKLQPQTQALQARLKWAKSVGDNHTQQATAKELQELFKKNGVSPLKPLLGGLVQVSHRTARHATPRTHARWSGVPKECQLKV